tara:strand:- start:3677 stop:4405 length:729 start_codon:yes stop_codon:yes gene_type:complete
MKKYRSIFLSDIHMGKTRSGYGGAKPSVDPLLKFIKNKEFDFVYLVGDIFDIWELLMNWKWESKYNTFIQEILRLSQQGSKIYYVTGNHDDILERMYGLDFNGIEFCKQVIHTTAKKKKFFVSHGQDYDPINKITGPMRQISYSSPKSLSWIPSKLVDWCHSVVAKLSNKTKLEAVQGYKERIMKKCYKDNYDGVICGHLHHPQIQTLKKGKIYINTGDSVSNFTVVTENTQGNFKLHKLKH